MKTLVNRENLIFSPSPPGCVLCLPGLPGADSKTQDRSHHGNHGTITGATWTRLPSGLWCLSFDGTDDLVTVPHTSELDIATGSFTARCWVWGDSASPDTVYMMRKGSAKYWQLRTSLKHPLFILYDGANSPQAQDNNTDLDDEAWHQIIGVRDYGRKIYLYVDGVEAATANDIAGSIADTGDLVIGNLTTSWYKGKIALQLLTQGAWTALDVQNCFNHEKHLFGVWQ
jgi:hypothetical protein